MPIDKHTSRPFAHATTIAHDRLDELYGMLTHIAEQVCRNADAIGGSDDRLRDVNERIEADTVPDVDRRLTLWRLARAAMVGVSPYLSVPTDANTTPIQVETDTVAALDRLYYAMHHPAGLRLDGHGWCDAIDVVKRTIDLLDASVCDPRHEQAIVPAVASFAETVSTIKAALDDAAPLPNETINAAESMATVVGPLLDYVRGCPDSRCPMVVDLIESTASCLNLPGMSGPNVSRCRELAAAWAVVLNSCDAMTVRVCEATPTAAVDVTGDEANPRKTGTDVADRLESLRLQGETFVNRKHYADTFGCGGATVSAAIHGSPELMKWSGWDAKQTKAARAVVYSDIVADRSQQSTEADPSDILTNDEVATAMAAILNVADSARRSELNELNDDGRRRIAGAYIAQQRDKNQPREYSR